MSGRSARRNGGGRSGRSRSARPSSGGGGLPAWVMGGAVFDDHDGQSVEVRSIQPYQATKSYTCPGCSGPIPPATGHLVVVPTDAVDDRRHWHRSCWTRRQYRRPR